MRTTRCSSPWHAGAHVSSPARVCMRACGVCGLCVCIDLRASRPLLTMMRKLRKGHADQVQMLTRVGAHTDVRCDRACVCVCVSVCHARHTMQLAVARGCARIFSRVRVHARVWCVWSV